MSSARLRGTTAAVGMTALALAAAACAPSSSSGSGSSGGGSGKAPKQISIGATLPLTGAEAKAGGRYKQGYELAVDEVNKAGGVDLNGTKVPVQLTLLDDTSDQAKANNLAQRLINENHVDAMLGTYTSPLVQAQATVAEQNKIPYVNGGGAATSIYSQGYKYVFGALAPVTLLAKTEMEWVDQQQAAGKLPKPAKVAIAWENTSHGKDYTKGIKGFVNAHPGKYQVVMDESFALDGKDFSSLLGKVKGSKADLFMADAHLPDFLTMQREYLSSGMCTKVESFGARGSEKDARETLGAKGVAYILSAVWWNKQIKDTNGLNKTFIEKYKAKNGAEPEWYQALGYEAARALFAGMHNAGSTDHQKVRDALGSLSMPSILPGGTLTFPKDSGQQANYPFVVQQNTPEGKSPIIYPTDLASGQGVAPNPNCKG